jgi:hypothetical protein
MGAIFQAMHTMAHSQAVFNMNSETKCTIEAPCSPDELGRGMRPLLQFNVDMQWIK